MHTMLLPPNMQIVTTEVDSITAKFAVISPTKAYTAHRSELCLGVHPFIKESNAFQDQYKRLYSCVQQEPKKYTVNLLPS